MSSHPVPPQRGYFESISLLAGSVIVIFGLAGAIVTLTDGLGPGAPGFLISIGFVILGAGRIYYGWRPRG